MNETRGVNFELLRHFLARIFDSEMFAGRGEWRTVAIGGFAMAIPAAMLLIEPPGARGRHAGTLANEVAVLTLLMAISGAIAVLAWQSMFPSRRDFLALAGLPVLPRQIFAARFAAVFLFASGMAAAVSILPGILRGGFAVSMLVCLTVFFAVVTVQGLLLSVLPRRMFVPVSTCIQGLLVGIFFLAGLDSWTMRLWDSVRVAHYAAWIPYARMAAPASLALAVLAYFACYGRYRKLMLEGADTTGRSMLRWSWMALVASNSRQEAILRFIAATLARSRTHRLALMAYCGAALGILINSVLLAGFSHASLLALRFAVLYWPIGASCIVLAGIRHVFSLPADWPSNWIFRMTENQGRRAWMSAVERFVLACVILPIYAVSAPAAAALIDWPIALRMTALQVLVSLTIFDLLFNDWQQLPFTCTYAPGKKSLMSVATSWIVVLGLIAPFLTIVISTVAELPELFLFYAPFFLGDWIWARIRRLDGWGESQLIYQDLAGSVASLGIKDMTYRVAEPTESEDTVQIEPPEFPEDAELPGVLHQRVLQLLHRDQLERDIDDELQFHLSMDSKSLGDVAAIKEECRDVWTFSRLERPWHEIRGAFGRLRATPFVSTAAALALAAGIAVFTVVFSLCDAVLWHLPKLAGIDSLVVVPARPATRAIASWSFHDAMLAVEGRREVRVERFGVTANFFDLLAAQPALGRGFLPKDEWSVILSDTCWRRRFAAEPAIVGHRIEIDGRDYEIAGVMPPSFGFPRAPRPASDQLWTPFNARAELPAGSIALLDPGKSLKGAQSVRQYWTGGLASQCYWWLAAAAVVLLACCAGAAIVLRRRTRMESWLVAGAAAMVGLLVSDALLHLVQTFMAPELRPLIPGLWDVGVRPLGLAIAVGAAVVFRTAAT